MPVKARVLLTGATGFVGANLARVLADREGVSVVAALRRGSNAWRIKDLAGRVETVVLDVTDERSVNECMTAAHPTHVVHCAAYGVNAAQQEVAAALDVNLHGPLRLLHAAAKVSVKRFVHLGSCFEYGDKPGRIKEDAVPEPTAIYGSTKAAAAILLRERAAALGIETVILRPFGLWGPLEPAHRLVPQIIAACHARQPLDLTACEQVRDYTFVMDMAGWIARIALTEGTLPFDVINLGSGGEVVLKDFVLRIARALGGENLMRFGVLPYRPREMRSLVADTKRAEVVLGRLELTPIEEGLQQMLGQAVVSPNVE